MNAYSLERTGKAPLNFEGEQLAGASSPPHLTRQHSVNVYRTKAGSFVVAISNWSTYKPRNRPPDPAHHFAFTCDSADQVPKILSDYREQIRDVVTGYPEGVDGYAKKQARLFREVFEDYDAQVSSVLDNPLFAERLD